MRELDVIDPVLDPRIVHQEVTLNGRQYHYLLAEPKTELKGTVFLAHGWPDLSLGWRYQIPLLMSLGFRVVCPDLIGYGGTEAPRVPPASIENYRLIEEYSTKTAASDINALAKKMNCSKIIMGGHDWGGLVAYRVALWYPDLVSKVFSVCTPYLPPTKHFVSTADLVQRKGMKFWNYQLQLASGVVEERVQSKGQIKQALNGVYGGIGDCGEVGFDVEKGFLFENLPKLRQTKVMDERTLDVYTAQYANSSMHQTKCWYSSLEQNFKDEKELIKTSIDVPTLFIEAARDKALPPTISKHMENFIPQLTRKSVNSDHWALWEAPREVNEHIRTWLGESQELPSSNL